MSQAALTQEETVMMETLSTAHPGDWISMVAERLNIPHFEASPKIAAYIERYVVGWLTYRTLYELAECVARLASIQIERHRLERMLARYEAELQQVIDKPARARKKKGVERMLGEAMGLDTEPNHLETLGTAIDKHGGGVFNYAKIIKEEREEALLRTRILDRLERQLNELQPKTRIERITLVHKQAMLEGRFPEAVRTLAMMPAEGLKAPKLSDMEAMAQGIAARMRGEAPAV
jgi:hypothetical protein